MCLGGGSVPQDNSAAIAAQQQATKEANVKAGELAIDKIFGGNTVTQGTGAATGPYNPSGTYYNADGSKFAAPVVDRFSGVPANATAKKDLGSKIAFQNSRGQWTFIDPPTVPTVDTSKLYTGTSSSVNPGQFTDDYYNNISKGYTDYYNPQLDTQYQNALNSLTLQLGQQGILDSSEGNRQLTLLGQNRDTQKNTIANNALSQAQTARQAVAQERQQLLSQNQQAANPSLAAQTAAAGAQSVQSQPSYSPLGAVFAGLLGQGTNALSIQQGGLAGTNQGGGTFVTPFTSTGALGPGSGGGSNTGKVVNG